MPADVAVIDCGSGNVRSLVNALQRVAPSGKTVLLTSEPSRILDVERAILPGVGAFGAVMQKLESVGWIPFLDGFHASGRPLLGICVGMQVFGMGGDELGIHTGREWVRGRARCMNSGPGRKLPPLAGVLWMDAVTANCSTASRRVRSSTSSFHSCWIVRTLGTSLAGRSMGSASRRQ